MRTHCRHCGGGFAGELFLHEGACVANPENRPRCARPDEYGLAFPGKALIPGADDPTGAEKVYDDEGAWCRCNFYRVATPHQCAVNGGAK